MHAGDTTVLEKSGPRSDDAFQKLLLRFSEAAAQGTPAPALIRLFCQATREFFQVDGTYFWRCASPEELVGAEADGLMAAEFRGRRLKARESAVAMEAIRQRRTVYVSDPVPSRYPVAAEFHAKSLMAAPLVVSNEVIGAAVFLQASEPDYFNDDLAAKATILAGQLGTLAGSQPFDPGIARGASPRRDPGRGCASGACRARLFDGGPGRGRSPADSAAHPAGLHSSCAKERPWSCTPWLRRSPQLAASARARFDRKGLQFAADLAARAIAADAPITVAIDPVTHALGDLVPAGMLLAAPIRTSRAEGAVLIYPRQEGAFSPEEKSLLSAVAGFGAVAIANAELYGTARAQAQELQQLLDILVGTEIGRRSRRVHAAIRRSRRRLPGFWPGLCRSARRWSVSGSLGSRKRPARPGRPGFSRGSRQPRPVEQGAFWANDPAKIPGANLEMIAKFKVRQLLAVPLLGTGGQVLGVLGVLDRLDRTGISQENIRSAQALAAQVAVTLEATRNLHLSEQHRRRAESLKGLALELNSQLRLPECARNFVTRAAGPDGGSSGCIRGPAGSGSGNARAPRNVRLLVIN